MEISVKADGDSGFMDELTVMKETLRVKDEELEKLARDLRTRESTIKEMAGKLSETIAAAEVAVSSAQIMEKELKEINNEKQKMEIVSEYELRLAKLELQAAQQILATTEKARDRALEDAKSLLSDLCKAREEAAIMKATAQRAEECACMATADAQVRVKNSLEKEVQSEGDEEEAEEEAEEKVVELHLQLDRLKDSLEKEVKSEGDEEEAEGEVEKLCLQLDRLI